MGEWQLAERAFSQACQLSPEYAEAWAYLSQAQEQLGQDGLPALNKAIALEPDSVVDSGIPGFVLGKPWKS